MTTVAMPPLPTPPIEPMLAKIADAIPDEPGFLFEPKWDGFRALVFRTGGRRCSCRAAT